MVRTNTRSTDPTALRVPDSLRELVGGRLARLPIETGAVLLEMAALRAGRRSECSQPRTATENA